jgi:hypothetical protein
MDRTPAARAAWLHDGIHEVGSGHTLHGLLNRVVVKQIAEDNLYAAGTQRRSTVVVAMYEGSNFFALRNQLVDSTPTSGARRTRYQIQFIAHRFLQKIMKIQFVILYVRDDCGSELLLACRLRA